MRFFAAHLINSVAIASIAPDTDCGQIATDFTVLGDKKLPESHPYRKNYEEHQIAAIIADPHCALEWSYTKKFLFMAMRHNQRTNLVELHEALAKQIWKDKAEVYKLWRSYNDFWSEMDKTKRIVIKDERGWETYRDVLDEDNLSKTIDRLLEFIPELDKQVEQIMTYLHHGSCNDIQACHGDKCTRIHACSKCGDCSLPKAGPDKLHFLRANLGQEDLEYDENIFIAQGLGGLGDYENIQRLYVSAWVTKLFAKVCKDADFTCKSENFKRLMESIGFGESMLDKGERRYRPFFIFTGDRKTLKLMACDAYYYLRDGASSNDAAVENCSALLKDILDESEIAKASDEVKTFYTSLVYTSDTCNNYECKFDCSACNEAVFKTLGWVAPFDEPKRRYSLLFNIMILDGRSSREVLRFMECDSRNYLLHRSNTEAKTHCSRLLQEGRLAVLPNAVERAGAEYKDLEVAGKELQLFYADDNEKIEKHAGAALSVLLESPTCRDCASADCTECFGDVLKKIGLKSSHDALKARYLPVCEIFKSPLVRSRNYPDILKLMACDAYYQTSDGGSLALASDNCSYLLKGQVLHALVAYEFGKPIKTFYPNDAEEIQKLSSAAYQTLLSETCSSCHRTCTPCHNELIKSIGFDETLPNPVARYSAIFRAIESATKLHHLTDISNLIACDAYHYIRSHGSDAVAKTKCSDSSKTLQSLKTFYSDKSTAASA